MRALSKAHSALHAFTPTATAQKLLPQALPKSVPRLSITGINSTFNSSSPARANPILARQFSSPARSAMANTTRMSAGGERIGMPSTGEKEARVGLGVFLFNDKGQFLVGKRRGVAGAGTISLAGGHLEYGESFQGCAAREAMEETGLPISNIRFLTANNNYMAQFESHYVTIFVGAELKYRDDVPQNMESEKCEGWYWTTWAELRKEAELQMAAEKEGRDEPRRVFQPLLLLFRQRPWFDPVVEYEKALPDLE